MRWMILALATAVTESGAVWTLVLQKLTGGWRVAGWAWAQH